VKVILEFDLITVRRQFTLKILRKKYIPGNTVLNTILDENNLFSEELKGS
jgi:hypothetical protein